MVTLPALSPNLPAPVSPQVSLVCSAPAFVGAPGKWLQMKSCVLALDSLHLQLSVSGRERPCYFSLLVVLCVLFGI